MSGWCPCRAVPSCTLLSLSCLLPGDRNVDEYMWDVLLPGDLSVCDKASSESTPFQVPITSFLLSKPEDDFPVMTEWRVHAESIFKMGFEAGRESVEVKVTDAKYLGRSLDVGALAPAKGFGRISILLFGILWTYHQEALEEHVEKDFKERPG